MEETEKNGQLPDEVRPIEPEQDAARPMHAEQPAEVNEQPAEINEQPLCEPAQETADRGDAEQDGSKPEGCFITSFCTRNCSTCIFECIVYK